MGKLFEALGVKTTPSVFGYVEEGKYYPCAVGLTHSSRKVYSASDCDTLRFYEIVPNAKDGWKPTPAKNYIDVRINEVVSFSDEGDGFHRLTVEWENGEKSVIVTINGKNCEYNTLRRAITLNKH